MKAQRIMSILGIILSSLVAHGTLHSPLRPTSPQDHLDQEAASILEDLIKRGFVVVDHTTGKLIVKGSVIDILNYYQLVEYSNEALTIAGGCSSCTGMNCDSK